MISDDQYGKGSIPTCVGVMWVMSSDDNFFKMVVLPALSRPNISSRTSRSGVDFNLRRKASKPCISGITILTMELIFAPFSRTNHPKNY